MANELIIIGAGGHASVLADVIYGIGEYKIIGAIANDGANHLEGYGIDIFGKDDVMNDMDPDSICLVNGIGSAADTALRTGIYNEYTARGFNFINVIHPSVIVASNAELNDGTQLMAGSIIQPGCRIEENTIINTASSVDHDCVVSRHAHISPGAVLCGNVTVGEGAHIGAGAIVIQGISIGEYAVVGAGAVVTRNVPAGAQVTGIPAK